MKKIALWDANNLFLRTFFSQAVEGSTETPHYNLWKYLSFDIVFEFIKKDLSIDEVVLAVDSSNSWRYEIFPRYKEARKETREKDQTVDWDSLFREYNSFLEEIKENIPFKVLKIDRCEADDIIGVICNNVLDSCVVISNDEDYTQLVSDRVQVYVPKNNSYIQCSSPERYLIKASLTGQAKDGIFNIKTPLDWPSDKRKPGFGPASAEKVLTEGYESWLKKNNLVERFELNRTLLDWKKVPQDIQDSIMKEYNEYKFPNASRLYDFFKNRNWKSYIEEFSYVENRLFLLY